MLSVFLPSFLRSSSVCAVAETAKSRAAAGAAGLMGVLPCVRLATPWWTLREPPLTGSRTFVRCTNRPGHARIRPHAGTASREDAMSLSHAVSMGIGPLAALGEDALKELAPHGTARAYPKNAVIINEGDETDSLYVL